MVDNGIVNVNSMMSKSSLQIINARFSCLQYDCFNRLQLNIYWLKVKSAFLLSKEKVNKYKHRKRKLKHHGSLLAKLFISPLTQI